MAEKKDQLYPMRQEMMRRQQAQDESAVLPQEMASSHQAQIEPATMPQEQHHQSIRVRISTT